MPCNRFSVLDLLVLSLLFRPLPWEYAIRNLFRRPLRTFLTFTGLTTVVVLVFVVISFVRGLESSLTVSGNSQTALIFSLGMGENLEYSSIPMRTSDLVSTSVSGIQQRYGQSYVSPELYLGTQVRIGEKDSKQSDQGEEALGLVRGITPSVLPVRRQVELEEGHWPTAGEILIGRLVPAKIQALETDLAIGQWLHFEGRSWQISGIFSANGSAFESEIWCRLDELQTAMKRQDLSLVALTLAAHGDFADLDLFCKERIDLELQATRELDYYKTLQRDYGPVRWLAWLVILLVSSAGIFSGLNTMYGSVAGRVAELATLQTIGFVRRAIILSLIQEGVLLAAAASLSASMIALMFIHGAAMRFTMGAFALRVDNMAVLIGCSIGFFIGFCGAIPPAIRALRMPIVEGLRAV